MPNPALCRSMLPRVAATSKNCADPTAVSPRNCSKQTADPADCIRYLDGIAVPS